ncbi:YybH family protein [Pelagibacterium sediminicola]|uniref:YybH family protein n=1 Tax=Pelagibacterium sediminicola TaxID=2248761 RepID=UPI000E31859E|nr:nuclear transport factor 2 family protein [Pelagibacterium sediminicola]
MSTTNDQEEIVALMRRMEAAWNSGDFAGYMNGFANPDVVFVSRGEIQADWAATLAHYQRDYGDPEGEQGHLTFSDLKIELLAPGVAQLVGTYTLVRGPLSQSGINTRILHKRPGIGWTITLNHVSARPDNMKR